MIPTLILCVCIFLTCVHCFPCDHTWAWKCPNDNLCLHRLHEVCAPPPRSVQRCPNGGDYGNVSCTQERCKELYSRVKCPNSAFCVDENDIDSNCPKDNNDKKNEYQVKCDKTYQIRVYTNNTKTKLHANSDYYEDYYTDYDDYEDEYDYISEFRNCTCPPEPDQTPSCSSFCQKLKLTKDEIKEYGSQMTFVKCQGANQCILKAQLCNCLLYTSPSPRDS